MVDLATIARELGNLTEARGQLLRAYQILVVASGQDDPTALAVEGRLATLSHRLGEPTDVHDWHLTDAGTRVLGPDHLAVREARARLNSQRPLPGTQPAPEPPVRQPSFASTGSEPVSWIDQPPELPEEPARRGRRAALALLAVVVAAALLGGAIVAVRSFAARSGGTAAPPAPTASAATSTAAPVQTGAPPAQVTLDDRGGSVVISWRDPTKGTVPFLVTGGRVDTAPQPLQTVAAGRTRSVIYGLNSSYNYCFTVTAVYSADMVASSPRACTHRVSVTPTR